MKIFKENLEGKENIIIQNGKNKFIMGWYGADLYWIMVDYAPNISFTITNSNPELFNFLNKLFSTYHFKNCTFNWVSEARLPENSSSLKITKGMDYYRIKFIQNPEDYFSRLRNICAICFCLSGSRHQDIANKFSILLHDLLKNKN